MTKSEIWQVTATLTIPNTAKFEGFPRIITESVAGKTQGLLENMRDDFDKAYGLEISFSVSSRKTGVTQ